jgi:mono/diheme cytochrome c family protein
MNKTFQFAGSPKVYAFGLLLVLAVTSACRQDMHDQPRYKPQARNDFFPDMRASRELVDGTVARGQLHEDTYFYTGKVGNNPGDAFPFAVTQQVLERGQQRYNIFCAPCHSRVGDGKGMIPSRGFSRMPPSYHIERLQKAPAGYFFDVITNGLGIMQGYSAQIPAQDRWAIIAYIRALQLSQNASAAELPSGQTVPSAMPKFEGDAPSGASPVKPAPVKAAKEGGAE